MAVDAHSLSLQFGDAADLVVICGGKEIKARQTVVCFWSPVLKQCCEEGLRVSNADLTCDCALTGAQEFGSVRLEFADYNLSTLSRVFLYCYTGDYSDECYPANGRIGPSLSVLSCEENNTRPKSPSQMQADTTDQSPPSNSSRITTMVRENLKVYLCAKTLAIGSLQAHALTKFESRCRDAIKEAGFAAVFDYVYKHTSTGDVDLRKMLIRTCMKNMNLIMRDEELLSSLRKNEPIAWSLLEETRTKNLDIRAAAKSSDTEHQAEIEKLKTECEQLRSEKKSPPTALVRYRPSAPAPDLPSSLEVTNLKTRTSLLRAENDQSKLELSKLTLEVDSLKHALRLESGKRQNDMHNWENRMEGLQLKLHNAEARLQSTASSDRAWGKLNKAKKSLQSEVDSLEYLIGKAERQMKDVDSCKGCDKAFWALLKVDLDKNDIVVQCGNCGQRH